MQEMASTSRDPSKKVGKLYSAGDSVVLSDFRPHELFPYHVYNKVFSVPQIKKRCLLITSVQLVDLLCNSLNSGASVLEVHSMIDLIRIKFKRGEVVNLTFKGDNVVSYGMSETDRCLDYIKLMMKQNGIKANEVTNRYKKNIATAQGLLETIAAMEADFAAKPSYQQVLNVMELFKDAVELFGEANDPRYLSALHQIQDFLRRADVMAILDNFSPRGRGKRATSKSDSAFFGGAPFPPEPPTGVPLHPARAISQRIENIFGPSGLPLAASTDADASATSTVAEPEFTLGSVPRSRARGISGNSQPDRAANSSSMGNRDLRQEQAPASAGGIQTAVADSSLTSHDRESSKSEHDSVSAPNLSRSASFSRTGSTGAKPTPTITEEPLWTQLASNSSQASSGDFSRSRVRSMRRPSIRTQSFENAQFKTMENNCIDDLDAEYVDEALCEDDESGGNLASATTDEDDTIKDLGTMLNKMTSELEGIIGAPVDFSLPAVEGGYEILKFAQLSAELGFEEDDFLATIA